MKLREDAEVRDRDARTREEVMTTHARVEPIEHALERRPATLRAAAPHVTSNEPGDHLATNHGGDQRAHEPRRATKVRRANPLPVALVGPTRGDEIRVQRTVRPVLDDPLLRRRRDGARPSIDDVREDRRRVDDRCSIHEQHRNLLPGIELRKLRRSIAAPRRIREPGNTKRTVNLEAERGVRLESDRRSGEARRG